MKIPTAKTEKTLKNSMLYELAPQLGLEPGLNPKFGKPYFIEPARSLPIQVI
jgi:hypothetical protein